MQNSECSTEFCILNSEFDLLVHHFPRPMSPAEAILRTIQRQHAKEMVLLVAARVAGDDQPIPDLELVPADALPVELERAAPFDGIPHDGPIPLAHHQMDEGMRVAEEQLH